MNGADTPVSEANRLKIAQQKELRSKQTPVQKIEGLIRQHKFAKNEPDKARAEVELKKYALELYKKDPQLISLSIRNKEIAEQVKTIVKEDLRQRGFDHSFER